MSPLSYLQKGDNGNKTTLQGCSKNSLGRMGTEVNYHYSELAQQDARPDSWPQRPPPPASHEPPRLLQLKSFCSPTRGSVQGKEKEHGRHQDVTRLNSTSLRPSD